MRNLSQSQTARIHYIYGQIDDIIYLTHQGIIEGVEVDLRHKHFDATNWDIPHALFKSRSSNSERSKFIIPLDRTFRSVLCAAALDVFGTERR